MRALDREEGLARAVSWFEALTPESLAGIAGIYADEAWFKDPFQEVRGQQAIAEIYRRMFERLDAPRFVIVRELMQGPDAFLTWNFTFGLRRPPRQLVIHGASHLRFGHDGRIRYHRDYWDPAEELYEKLPLLGRLMRMLKRAVHA